MIGLALETTRWSTAFSVAHSEEPQGMQVKQKRGWGNPTQIFTSPFHASRQRSRSTPRAEPHSSSRWAPAHRSQTSAVTVWWNTLCCPPCSRKLKAVWCKLHLSLIKDQRQSGSLKLRMGQLKITLVQHIYSSQSCGKHIRNHKRSTIMHDSRWVAIIFCSLWSKSKHYNSEYSSPPPVFLRSRFLSQRTQYSSQ